MKNILTLVWVLGIPTAVYNLPLNDQDKAVFTTLALMFSVVTAIIARFKYFASDSKAYSGGRGFGSSSYSSNSSGWSFFDSDSGGSSGSSSSWSCSDSGGGSSSGSCGD